MCVTQHKPGDTAVLRQGVSVSGRCHAYDKVVWALSNCRYARQPTSHLPTFLIQRRWKGNQSLKSSTHMLHSYSHDLGRFNWPPFCAVRSKTKSTLYRKYFDRGGRICHIPLSGDVPSILIEAECGEWKAGFARVNSQDYSSCLGYASSVPQAGYNLPLARVEVQLAFTEGHVLMLQQPLQTELR